MSYFFPPPWFFNSPPPIFIPQQTTISDNDTFITSGIQGTQGLSGQQGTQGFNGLQGFSGVQGLQGTQGLSGQQGTQGFNGLQGFSGVQGLQGTQGLSGEQGLQGTQGFNGLQGIQGLSGSNVQQQTCILNTKIIYDNYYVQPDDCYIGVLNSKQIDIILPAEPEKGRLIIIKAQQKQLGDKKIYIISQNGEKIDSADQIVLQSPYESVTLLFNDNWHITGQAQV